MLESRSVLRGVVYELHRTGGNDSFLEGRTADRWVRWPGGGNVVESGEGCLRIDLVADDVVRVRYAARAAAVPDGRTPMVVGDLPPATPTGRLRTATLAVEVADKPFGALIRDAQGREVARVGGREKNEWSLWDSYNTGISRCQRSGRPLATETFALRPGEAVYGFGEQFCGLDKVGQTIDLDMVEATGTTTPRAYKNVPFFWTTAGYGVFLNTSARVTVWVGSRCAADVQIAVEDDHLDYYVFVGDPRTILDRYTQLTGKAAVPPRWSFGWWQSKISYRSAEEVRAVVERQRGSGLPLDVVHLDTHWFREDWRCDLEFDPERFPDPATFLAELAAVGIKVSLWQLPYIPEGSALFEELLAADGFVKHPDGGLYDIGLCYTPGFRGRVGCIDFTNPQAIAVYSRHLRRLFELGARVIKADFGEQAPLDGVYADGTPGHRVHNLYPLLYNRAVAEATAAATGEHIIWARSAWAGSQRYPLHWGGDSSANWDNLGPQLAGGLSLGVSGFSFWSQDIGGFLGETGGDLLIRWLQAGLFLSHARIHGVGTRELDAFGGEVLRIGRDYLRLRYRLMPYLFAAAHDCAARGLPMARALVVEFPDDPTTWRIADQWLLGDALMVAPILDPSGRRRVYLPAGRWADWWTGERIVGPKWSTVEAPLEVLPLWVREGGVVPLGPEMRWVGEVPTREVVLRLAPLTTDGDRRFTVAVDDDLVEARYARRGGRHSVAIAESPARFSVEVLGGTEKVALDAPV